MPETPNILIIWGDDIGISNLSCYSDGLMGYRTPNIDRIAAEGVRFTDYYGEQSCTAGRAAFITGQNPYRTGLTKVGMPGADIGLRAEDPTIATALKALGYAHRAVRQEPLRGPRRVPADRARVRRVLRQPLPPQRRGGARASPTTRRRRSSPNFRKRFGPRGVIHAWATPSRRRTAHRGHRSAHQGADEDHRRRGGPRGAALHDRRQGQRHAVLRLAEHHPHALPHPRQGRQPRARPADGSRSTTTRWSTTTSWSGQVLDYLDEHGLADNTIVMYSTDNGPHMNTWPDAGMTPFRNEKNSNWEGAYRVPAMVRWPGHIPAGQVLNGIVSHNDWFVTLLAAAGDTDVADRLKAGTDLNGTTYKVHLDGHNQLDYITGAADESPRKHFFYVSDDGDLTALRYDNWKFVFLEQRKHGHAGDLARAVRRAARAPRSSTCGPTRTSGPTSRRTPTSTGCSTTPGW